MSLPPRSKCQGRDDASQGAQHLREHLSRPESSFNPGNKSDEPPHASRGALHAPSPTPSFISLGDSIDVHFGPPLSFVPCEQGQGHAPRPPLPRTLKNKIKQPWVMNKGLALVLIAQLFGTLMNVATRMLEMEGNDGKGYHPFQILFARMGITVVCSSFYMWYTNTEHFPWGLRQVRPLLIARGLTGFFGIFGMYYSLLYLPLADATVITFLAPSLACWACSFLINEPFTRMEQIAAYVSLFGVILIARPVSLFAAFKMSGESAPVASGDGDIVPMNTTMDSSKLATDYDAVTPSQRAKAVGIAMLGVLGAAGAYTTIRWIGRRAHPLISVNYFAIWCTIVSIVAMFTMPSVGFLLPNNLRDWMMLIFLGTCGFVMQFLLAAGLQYEKSSRATNMVYVQMLFALTFDKLVWGITPGFLSIIGSLLILGSAIYVALHKEQPQLCGTEQERGHVDEERGLMSLETDRQSSSDDE